MVPLSYSSPVGNKHSCNFLKTSESENLEEKQPPIPSQLKLIFPRLLSFKPRHRIISLSLSATS